MAGENGAPIQISEERNDYFRSLIVCRVFLQWTKKNRFFGGGRGEPHLLKVRVFVDMWVIILSQQMNNQAVRAPNTSGEET